MTSKGQSRLILLLGWTILTTYSLAQEQKSSDEEEKDSGSEKVEEYKPSPEEMKFNEMISKLEEKDRINCEKPGYECKACEEDLQNELNGVIDKYLVGGLRRDGHWSEADASTKPSRLREGVEPSDVLRDIKALLMKHDGGLNQLVMGHSESAQPATPGNPRFIWKSGRSELQVSFGTDPENPSFDSIEIQRWNGKKGRYEFQRLVFKSAAKIEHEARKDREAQRPAHPHHAFDPTKQSCIQCHGNELTRPKWDTYRAWGGLLPPRGELTYGRQDTEAYLDTLQESVLARNVLESPRKLKKLSPGQQERFRRLALMEFPGFDELNGVPDAERVSKLRALIQKQYAFNPDADESETTDAATEDQSENSSSTAAEEPAEVEVPEVDYLLDKDGKLLPLANSSFVSSGIVIIPHYAGGVRGGAGGVNQTNDPPAVVFFDQSMALHGCQVARSLKEHPNFARFKAALLGLVHCDRDNSTDKDALSKYLPKEEIERRENHYKKKYKGASTSAVESLLAEIEEDGKRLNEYKNARHKEFLKGYLKKKKAGAQTTKNVLESELTVDGVEESDPKLVSAVRYLLEPEGVDMSSWSLSVGKSTADISYTFADQFETVINQGWIRREFEERLAKNGDDVTKTCKELSRESYRAFNSKEKPPLSDIEGDLRKACASAQNSSKSEDKKIPFRSLGFAGRAALTTCLECHGPKSTVTAARDYFPLDTDDAVELEKLLKEDSPKSRKITKNMLSAVSSQAMPPNGWKLGAWNEKLAHLSAVHTSAFASAVTQNYLEALKQKKDPESMELNCDLVFPKSQEDETLTEPNGEKHK